MKDNKQTKIKHGTPNNLDTKAAVEALEYLLAAGYVSKKRLYWANFVRGIFFSMGTIVGIAIISTIVISILSQFDSFPRIHNLKQSIEQSVHTKQSTNDQ